MGQWVQTLGEEIGAQLGQIIAARVQQTVMSSINVGDLAARVGAGGAGRRGRRPATGARAICSVPGCGRPVLAKGLCRSHYYRARYQAQKSGTLKARSGGRRRRKGAARAQAPKKRGKPARPGKQETPAAESAST